MDTQFIMPAEKKLVPGTVIPFGGIFWRVLDVDIAADKALVISEHSVAGRSYYIKGGSVSWEKSDIRAWLNGEYLNSAFSDEERAAIMESETQNPDNPQHGTKGGNPTNDKIFLLCIEEAKAYFKSDEDRALGEWWWLRSPGYHVSYAALVNYDGSLDVDGYNVRNVRCIRPAFYINLGSEIIKPLIIDKSPESITFHFPQVAEKENVILEAAKDIKAAVIPEGITEIGEGAFRNCTELVSVVFPASLKKVGKEAFAGCNNLVSVSGGGAISYGNDVFGVKNSWSDTCCKKLRYTSEMFMNTGKLCDSFAEHIGVCDATALAWVYMYQKGELWGKALAKQLTAENASSILAAMTEHIRDKKSPKMAAIAAAAFVHTNANLLPGEEIKALLDTLREKKQGEIADELAANPAVASFLFVENMPKTESRVHKDGNIFYDNVEVPLAVGEKFFFGDMCWRILSIADDNHTGLVISERIVDKKAYNNKRKNITWEKSDIRAWLNGVYFITAFSEEERTAILESEIQNHKNLLFGTTGGNSTKDHIFLLSDREVETYFTSYKDRAIGEQWWLRSPVIWEYVLRVSTNSEH